MSKEETEENGLGLTGDSQMHDSIRLSGLYESWFLDYASYVILERAVPMLDDGLKPVQRRILHAMKEMDDGRFNKVANIIGSAMQYHPHGDASIGDAAVNMGQKDLLIETQGNWGDIRTGDNAAAPRYIEARLSKFALEVVFNPQTTNWQLSYDGRKKEPVALPVKFPLLLAQGAEGIAVGLSTKIMPHNFHELCKGAIDHLKGKRPKILPDFLTGGMADFSEYNDGKRGGRIKVRAKIEELDKKTLVIRDIPFGTTTSSLIESILKANDKGKIKIKQVVDNTAQDVEIEIVLASGQSPDIMIDALYAFTDCEVSISPNACVIIDDKPHFKGVTDILRENTDQTKNLLEKELEIRKAELLEKILFSSLEKIFIENRIYRDIEECETWEAVIETIDAGLEPFKSQFYREITQEDIVRLTEIKIKRISRFDAFKADEQMKALEEELQEVEHNLANLVEYTINYFQHLLDKYGKGRERKTEIKTFDTIKATVVAANNQKLYVDRDEGFIGWGIKKFEYVSECSDLDDILVIRKDGIMKVSRIQEKVFMGRDILYVGIFKKNDERMVYNLIYVDGKSGKTMVKRFSVLGVTRDKEYNLTKGTPGSKVLWVTGNPNGEAETVTIKLTAASKARKKVFDYDFSDLEIKGRGAGGNILTRYSVRKIELKAEGVSTLSGLDIWYDSSIGRLNKEERGAYIGNFNGDDKIVVVFKDGSYQLTSFELTNRYEYEKILFLTKLTPETVISAVHYDPATKDYYVKRFAIETSSEGKEFKFISEEKGAKLILASDAAHPVISYTAIKGKAKQKEEMETDLSEFIDVKGWRAMGNKLSQHKVSKIKLMVQAAEETPKHTQTKEPSNPADTDAQLQLPVTGSSKSDIQKPSKTGKQKSKPKKKPPKKDGNGFDVGTTIELDL